MYIVHHLDIYTVYMDISYIWYYRNPSPIDWPHNSVDLRKMRQARPPARPSALRVLEAAPSKGFSGGRTNHGRTSSSFWGFLRGNLSSKKRKPLMIMLRKIISSNWDLKEIWGWINSYCTKLIGEEHPFTRYCGQDGYNNDDNLSPHIIA